MSNPGFSLLSDLTRIKDARTKRLSSWDHEGKNQDSWQIPPGESVVLADIKGPGCITHIWATQACRRVLGPGALDLALGKYLAPAYEIHNALGLNWEIADPHYYRKVLIRMTWDNAAHPAVLVPLGDFFGVGHSMPGNFSSLPLSVCAKPDECYRFGGSAALNCYFQMPFNERALIELVNENDVPYRQYFYIDYETYDAPLDEDVAYFHANWRRENPCDGWAPQLQVNSPETELPNLTGEGNYTVLETEGRGQYVGCLLSVAHFQGSWWGEGDDMIFIDDDSWPPSLHGTGTEDYFNHAWCMQDKKDLYNGSAVHDSVVPGYQVSYRFHLTDPVRFKKKIRVTIEHGHANHLSDDWASVAYWYQTLPGPKLTVLPVAQRLPSPPGARYPVTTDKKDLTARQQELVSQAEVRHKSNTQLREKANEAMIKKTRSREAANKEAGQKRK